ncbi:MAG: beta strand repeat-containing protein, partial [Planctomycetia bacterium]
GQVRGITGGSGSLTLNTAGNIIFSNDVGISNALGDIFITGSNPSSLTVNGGVTAASLKTDTGRTVSGQISITGTQTYSGADGLVLSGNSNISVAAITTTNPAAPIQLSHFGNLNLLGNIQAAGSFDQTSTGSGVINIGATIPSPPVTPVTTTSIIANNNTLLDFDANLILNNNLLVQTTFNNANVSFAKDINSASGTKAGLTVRSTGVLQFTGNIGNQVQLGDINTANQTLSGLTATTTGTSINASSFTSGSVLGDITITVPQVYNGTTGLILGTTAAGGVSNDITIGQVTTQNGGPVQINNSDILNITQNLNMDGSFSQLNNSGSAQIKIGATSPISIITSGDDISFQGQIVLVQNSTLQTGGLGNVSFSETVNSTSSGGASSLRTLTVNNTSGTTNFNKSVGAGVNGRLGSLSITSTTINLGQSTAIQVITGSSTGQSYNGAVRVNSATTLDSNSAGPVAFSSTVDSGSSTSALAVNNTTSIQFNNRVGATS